MTARLRFGVFLAPFHKPGINPTLALQNDLDLVAWLDRVESHVSEAAAMLGANRLRVWWQVRRWCSPRWSLR